MSEVGTRAKKKTTKKKTNTKKKTTNTIRLTAKEKKLIQDYRKCNMLEKRIIEILVEKAAGGLTRLEGLENL